jgi:ABC-type transport system substrate-binding protein
VKDRPYLDGFDVVVLPEYATGLAQFRTGNLWTYPVKQEDIVPTKKGVPQLNMFQASAFASTVPSILTFGYNPGSPFMDERVRQAASMLIDREQWMTTFYNIDKFKADGLNVPTAWASFVPIAESKYYLNPQSKDLGDGAKYFTYNPAEARKLLQAATGNKLPLASTYTYTTNGYGVDYVQQSQALQGMLEAGDDFKLKVDAVDYNGVFRFGFSNAPGNYDGMAPTPTSPKANIDQFIFAGYHSKGSRNKFPGGDPKFDDLVSKQRSEPDQSKRVQYVQELQRYAATKMYSVPFGGLSLGFTLAWPWVGNFQAYNSWVSDPVEAYTYYWYDQSKRS